jgi:hypothetical protein
VTVRGAWCFPNCNLQAFKGTLTHTWLKGKVGSAMVPGFTRVYNRATSQLVPCTRELCPYAERRTLLNGNVALVNYAPWKVRRVSYK